MCFVLFTNPQLLSGINTFLTIKVEFSGLAQPPQLDQRQLQVAKDHSVIPGVKGMFSAEVECFIFKNQIDKLKLYCSVWEEL